MGDRELMLGNDLSDSSSPSPSPKIIKGIFYISIKVDP